MSWRDVKERADRGAAWLDATVPGWADAVNLDHLSLESSCRCVLGQVFAPAFAAIPQEQRPSLGWNGFDLIRQVSIRAYGQSAEQWAWFVEHGARRICVDVGADEARPFYRRHGAVELNRHWMVWADIGRVAEGG